MKAVYVIMIGSGTAGFVITLGITLIKSSIDSADWWILILSAILSMAVITLGIHGFDELMRRSK